MKVRALLFGIVLMCVNTTQAFAREPQKGSKQGTSTPASPSQSSKANAPAETKIDPGKEAAIRKLIALSGGLNAAKEMMDGMQKNMRPVLSNAFPPGEYRDKLVDLFFEKFRSKADMHVMEEMTVRAYDKYFTEDDVNDLIKFYSTPIGQKTITVMPQLMVELQGEGMKWGQDLGRQSMLEVMDEHPELRQAIEDAQKKAQTH
jgi:uncharacterized protein